MTSLAIGSPLSPELPVCNITALSTTNMYNDTAPYVMDLHLSLCTDADMKMSFVASYYLSLIHQVVS